MRPRPPSHLRISQRLLPLRHNLFAHARRRFYSTNPNSKHTSRLHRVHSRLPRFLQRFTTPLLDAPLTHITSFLLLHELTAVIPLFTLAGIFHYTHWLPPFISEGKWISDGVEKFGRYFRRKGWLRDGEVTQEEVDSVVDEERGETKGVIRGVREKWWGRGEGGVRLVVEFATAWAVTKALLPARLIVSVWGTPWFARVAVVPGLNLFKRMFGRGKKVTTTGGIGGAGAVGIAKGPPARGTGATGGGAVGRETGKNP
ncbi:MAG: hypothetical protein MMC23_001533 [Stictis urceolatum]|nr:hypothetical protein [Stictis urceolata]